MRLDSKFFRQSYFRFVVNFLKATEACKRESIDGDCADFADGRVFNRQTTAFSMDQDKHVTPLPLRWTQHKTPKCVQMLGTTESMVTRNEMEFDRERGVA